MAISEQARADAMADADALLRDVAAWIGATAERLNSVPRPSGEGGPFSHGRALLDAVEGGRAWSRKIEEARAAFRAVPGLRADAKATLAR